MRRGSKYAGGSVMVAISIVAVGSMSVLLLGVGARRVPSAEMANFVTNWVAINTTLVALGASFDQLGPRLLAQDSTIGAPLVVHGTVLPLIGSLLAIATLWAAEANSASLVTLTLYATAVSLWTGERSLRLGSGEFRALAYAAAAAAGGCALTLGFFMATGNLAGEHLFYSGAAGHLVGFVFLRLMASTSSRSGPLRLLGSQEYRLAASVALSSASVLVISSGGLVLASWWGVTDRRLVAYAGIVNLVRVPFMIMNSTSGPLNVEIARSTAAGNLRGASLVAAKWAALMTAASALVGVAVFVAGSALLEAFIGSGYRFELGLAMAVVAVEALLWISGAPRFLAIAVGRAGRVAAQWAAGGVAFLVVALQSALDDGRLIAAPLAGAAVTALLSGVGAIWMTRRHIPTLVQNQ
jgi:hypothetical protein